MDIDPLGAVLLPICLVQDRVPAVPLLAPPVAMETHPFIRLDYHNQRSLFSEAKWWLFSYLSGFLSECDSISGNTKPEWCCVLDPKGILQSF